MLTSYMPLLCRIKGNDGANNVNDYIAYSGFVQVHDTKYQLALRLPSNFRPGRSLKGTLVWTDDHLATHLRGLEGLLQQRIAMCTTLSELGKELIQFLEESIAPRPTLLPLRNVPILLQDLSDATNTTVVNLSTGFRKAHLHVFDATQRKHNLYFDLPTEYPLSSPTVTCDLPEPFRVTWDIATRISGVVACFSKCLEWYQDLWAILDDIDTHTIICHQLDNRYSSAERTIEIGLNCYLRIVLSVSNPREVPQMSFSGAEPVVKRHQVALNNRIGLWDYTKMVRENMQVILDIVFPDPSTKTNGKNNNEDNEVLCEICYVGDMLDVICPTESCGRRYHSECLLSLFRREGRRQSFNMVFETEHETINKYELDSFISHFVELSSNQLETING